MFLFLIWIIDLKFTNKINVIKLAAIIPISLDIPKIALCGSIGKYWIAWYACGPIPNNGYSSEILIASNKNSNLVELKSLSSLACIESNKLLFKLKEIIYIIKNVTGIEIPIIIFFKKENLLSITIINIIAVIGVNKLSQAPLEKVNKLDIENNLYHFDQIQVQKKHLLEDPHQ